MIDAHIHLDQYDLKEMDRYVTTWQEKGVNGVIAVSSDLASSYKTLELHSQYPTFIYPAIGFHPEKELPSSAEFTEWIQLLRKERESIVAIGEVGLPHYELSRLGGAPYLERAIAFFETIVKLAVVENLPLLLHAVYDKVERALSILERNQVEAAHFHWLKAPAHLVSKIVKRGYFVSVTPEVCYRKRDQELVDLIPLTLLLVETDGPWPYSGLFEGRETTPVLLHEIVRCVAMLKGMDVDTIDEACQNNAQKLLAYRSLPRK
ncbi:TatD family hydrolase [Caldalkalibacillus mannanilyticus]|uniref:TatD family hydrolase n=1 Tax=Caldalkalibacillus mannanilyticus TaxID=1418 RepID=UPI000468BB0B|nr:TatD family hydrolase [Caldalkalibacillus mannanilyticus]